MKHLKKNNNFMDKKAQGSLSRGRVRILLAKALLTMAIMVLGCSDFVEVDPPKNILATETVFEDPATVESALAHIYHSMREAGMVSGNFGLTALMGLYTDELDYHGFDPNFSQFHLNNVMADNSVILGWWSHAYSLIYGANNIIKGVGGGGTLATGDSDRFMGQALFIRAYIHSLLVSLYGDVPYVATTDYLVNNSVSRTPVASVYDNIIADLEEAAALLEGLDTGSGERVVPDQYVVKALLARIYLYTEQWEAAEALTTQLIDVFALETHLDRVFLKESPETIWQFKPGESPRNTQEANQLVIRFIPGQTYALTDSFTASFEPGDQRAVEWMESISDADNTVTLQFAHKYKALFNETESLEYSIVFRLAEQFLIRAEARAQLGNLTGAQQDINLVRGRAGLDNTTANTKEGLLEAVLQERRVELFAEHGHRWVDLKRTGRAGEVLGGIKPNWQDTDTLLPIPEAELEINPELMPQNPGY